MSLEANDEVLSEVLSWWDKCWREIETQIPEMAVMPREDVEHLRDEVIRVMREFCKDNGHDGVSVAVDPEDSTRIIVTMPAPLFKPIKAQIVPGGNHASQD